MDDIQTLMVKACGPVYMFVMLNWRTGETYFAVERAGKQTRCATLREAERVYQFECGGGKHRPCKHRKRETRDGVEMDWCYAIGCDRVGDMPCVYCADKEGGGHGKA